MKNIFDKLKDAISGKKEPTIKELYDNMDALLEQAEADIGGNFFPKEKVLSTEEVHYAALKLKVGASFELIQDHYKKLKEKYNPEKYKDIEKKYKKAKELDARIEIAFSYFKNKFGIN